MACIAIPVFEYNDVSVVYLRLWIFVGQDKQLKTPFKIVLVAWLIIFF